MDACLKLIDGNGGTFPDLFQHASGLDEGNKNDSIDVESNKKNDDETNTDTENTNTNIENENTGAESTDTDTSGSTADDSINKGIPTLKEPPSGRTDVQPPENINLQSYCKLKIFFYMHFTH